jgi:hypothetical protein
MKYGIVGLVLLLLTLPAWAQAQLQGQRVDSPSGLSLILPRGWESLPLDAGIGAVTADRAAGIFSVDFGVVQGVDGSNCLSTVQQFFVDALELDNVRVSDSNPSVASFTLDGGATFGVITCDTTTQTRRIIGTVLIVEDARYDELWPTLLQIYDSLEIGPARGGSTPAQPTPAPAPTSTPSASAGGGGATGTSQLTSFANGIRVAIPAGWSVVSETEFSVFLADPTESGYVFASFGTRGADLTPRLCVERFVENLKQDAFYADMRFIAESFADANNVINEYLYNRDSEIGVIGCEIAGNDYRLFMGTVFARDYDALWPTISEVILSVLFPGQTAPTPAQPTPAPVTTGGSAGGGLSGLQSLAGGPQPTPQASSGASGLQGLTGGGQTSGQTSQPQPAAARNPFARVLNRALTTVSVNFTSFTDPVESAYTVDVPRGWRASGGLVNAFGVRGAYTEIMSPDENVFVFAGATDLVVFLEPSAELNNLGLPDGSLVTSEGLVTVLVTPLRTGASMGQLLIETTIGELCSNLRVVDSFDLPALGGTSPDRSTAISAGEIVFTCVIEGQNVVGYQYTTTYQTRSSDFGSVWTVGDRYGFIAAADRVDEAATVMRRVIESFAVSPQWEARTANAQIGGASNQALNQLLAIVGQMQRSVSGRALANMVTNPTADWQR